eukprot:5750521-Pyramimonas_sp.AAC.1
MVEPRTLPAAIKPGCSRYPCSWGPVRRQLQQVSAQEELSNAWLTVLNALEVKLAGRHDIVGESV